MSTRTEHFCDICRAPATLLKVPAVMRFTTEQTEGRSCKPYLEITHMDLCETCQDRMIAGQPLEAFGAQGSNQYEWKERQP